MRSVVMVVAILAVLSLSLPLWHYTAAFASREWGISLTLNSAQFIPLSSGEGNQVKVTVNYTALNSTLLGQSINAAIKVYVPPNATAIKSTSLANGFIVNSSGIQELKTTIIYNQTRNVTAVVQFTDATKTIPVSNPIQARLNLTQGDETTITTEIEKPEIADLPP